MAKNIADFPSSYTCGIDVRIDVPQHAYVTDFKPSSIFNGKNTSGSHTRAISLNTNLLSIFKGEFSSLSGHSQLRKSDSSDFS